MNETIDGRKTFAADGAAAAKATAARSTAVKAVALTAAGLALLSGCGEPRAVPMNDEYAGDSGESSAAPSGSDSDNATNPTAQSTHSQPSSDKKDTGNYADGDYKVQGVYGPIGEDTIDVTITVKDGNVANVDVVGHPFTTISKNHQNDFAAAINGVVDGKPLKDLKIDTVAGASWTSDAFNEALKVARQEASIQ
ncbi:FMN-binding protein [Bifidobacterium avesanii]|uniref:FMN-binding protein n=1 Tax=Bifidobacterium avesanii TaxID=1798157 RepID=A0A7K3TJM8_9BIFI|nr:FMN-binding protein [Bifidobacterium avesanii]NEG79231.1 FMN-binding protein [Bifidobacterium avesanii]